jgi:hypothetical protein
METNPITIHKYNIDNIWLIRTIARPYLYLWNKEKGKWVNVILCRKRLSVYLSLYLFAVYLWSTGIYRGGLRANELISAHC